MFSDMTKIGHVTVTNSNVVGKVIQYMKKTVLVVLTNLATVLIQFNVSFSYPQAVQKSLQKKYTIISSVF